MTGMTLKTTLGDLLGPQLPHAAPGLTTAFVREALDRAVHGIGPLPPAVVAAERQLAEQRGHVDRAVHEVIENHVRLAGAQGFATNLGGLVTVAVMLPTNIIGLAVIQSRMVAGIAHLRGYDLTDPRVKNAVLACLLGEEMVDAMVASRRLPAPPMALATAPVLDPHLEQVIAAEVAASVISKVAGRRALMAMGRRIPVVGGLVGLGADGFVTWRVGRYADRELLPRVRR